MNFGIYILAGGKSSRFGSDKARALIDGQPQLLRLTQSLRFTSPTSPPAAISPPIPISDPHPPTAIAATADAYADLGVRTIADRFPGSGPLAGIDAALADSPFPWTLILSCDLAHTTLTHLPHLLRRLAPTLQAIAFRSTHWEPFPGLYHTSLAPLVQDHLTRRRLSVQSLLSNCTAQAVPLPPDWPTTPHFNTPEELTRIPHPLSFPPLHS